MEHQLWKEIVAVMKTIDKPRFDPQCTFSCEDRRLRSIELLENPKPEFGRGLLKERDEIERKFGNLSNWGGGLTHLPPWARTHRRVHRWTQAKLIIDTFRHPIPETTYVN